MTITILNQAQTAKAIESIKNRGLKLDNDIHTAALSCLSHHHEHGDITLMNRLITAMPKSGRRNALVAWALHFGSFAMNTDKASRAETPLLHVKPVYPLDLDGANDTPFWDFKAQEGTPTWSFDTWLASQQKALNSALGKTTDDKQKAKIEAALLALTQDAQ